MARTNLRLPPGKGPAALDGGSIQFVGTATVLVRMGGLTLLTDPNFLHAGDHAHLGWGLTTPRLTDPALEIDDLPPLDLGVLSHFHGDHWDEVATARLPKELPVLTTRHAARALRRRGFRRAVPLATWDEARVEKGAVRLRVTALPARHGPGPLSALLPPVMGSMLEWSLGEEAPRFRLYLSGDTLVHPALRRIPERFPHVDVGVFHLGGTRVLGILVTLDADQGVEAVRIVHPDVAIPVHYDDYPVFRSPLADFSGAVARAGLSGHVEYLQRGETYEFRLEGPGRADEVAARVTPRWRREPRPEPPLPGDEWR